MDIISLLCPCLKASSSTSNRGHGSHNETELVTTKKDSKNGSNNGTSSSLSSLYSISRTMSAPTIKILGLDVKGHGLALVNVSIEQDCAYWEWHVNIKKSTQQGKSNVDDGEDDVDDEEEDDFFNQGMTLKFGVATKKNRDFYRALNSNEDDDAIPMDDGTKLMKPIQNIQNGDTIGIAIQQDDLPMIQFLLNGEPLHDIAINRFRGTVYPSVFIDGDDDDKEGDEEVNVRLVWNEEGFKEMSPSVRFKPLMAARGII